MSIRLGYHYHIPARQTVDGILMPSYQGRFIDSLAKWCGNVVCFLHSPLESEQQFMDYKLRAQNVKLVDLGLHSSVPMRLFKSFWTVTSIREYLSGVDVMLLRGPSPLLPIIGTTIRNMPLVLMLVGDYLPSLNHHQPKWRQFLIWTWLVLNTKSQMEIARHNLTIVNSRLLYNQYRNRVQKLFEIRTTTLDQTDFTYKEDTCKCSPCHLLFVGRMSRLKGLIELIEAVSILVQGGDDVILDLVGPIESNDSIVSDLERVAKEFGISERVLYHGYKALGAELFAFYQRADIFVVASLSSFEGFPRVIWEAMSQSLPVVATTVGSVPFYLSNEVNALLVPPGDSVALAHAIACVLHTPELRRRMISAGYVLAKENTLEKRSFELVKLISEHCDSYRQ